MSPAALKSLARRLAFAALARDWRLARRRAAMSRAGVVAILNLHRVDDDRSSAYPAMPPAIFDDLLGWLKPRFRIVALADLATLERDGPPPLVLSFDDGYRDFIEIVMPILRRHGLRANQNVVPACVEGGRPPLNVLLQDFIGQAPAPLLREIETPWLPGGFDPDDRAASGMRASRALKNRPMVEQEAIMSALAPDIARFDAFRPTPMMSRAQVIEAAASGHEIGAHSWSHASMAVESDAVFADDVARCRSYFETTLGLPMTIYAFPNGSRRDGQVETLRRAGVAQVLLVDDDFASLKAPALKRFTMRGDDRSEARYRAHGGSRAVADVG